MGAVFLGEERMSDFEYYISLVVAVLWSVMVGARVSKKKYGAASGIALFVVLYFLLNIRDVIAA